MPLIFKGFDVNDSNQILCIQKIGEVYKDFISLSKHDSIYRLELIVHHDTNDEVPMAIESDSELIIKLHTAYWLPQVIFQFSHELCHFYFFSRDRMRSSVHQYYIGKTNPSENEEEFCTALSLAYLYKYFNEATVNRFISSIHKTGNEFYIKGILLYKECECSADKIVSKIDNYIENNSLLVF